MFLQYRLRRQSYALCAPILALAGMGVAQSTPSPQQLIEAAHKASDATPLIPYELNATVIVDPGTKNEHRGHLTIYRDHDRVREDLQIADMKDSYLRIGDKSYLSPREALLSASGTGNLDHMWDPGPSVERTFAFAQPKFSFGRVSRDKKLDAQAWCFDKKTDYRKVHLCFDADRGVLLRESVVSSNSFDAADKRETEFSDFTTSGQVTYPRTVKIARGYFVPIEVRDITIEAKPLAEDVFAIPENSLEMESCAGEKPPKIRFQPEPEFPESSGRKSVHRIVGLNIIVTREGVVTGIRVVRSAGTDFDQKAEQAVAKWRFEPAKCGARPVNVEVYVEMDFNR